ncbi:MAG TPA: 3-dehydroquinate synthase [Elusimicrobia bacterium]|nr:MAG: 3-dehydroquinate synthase [Elusimicrobia bacterium RIFOXYA12_FULL_49_49]OGS09556.1 MAG: 3-dehydroquinate synthase [Elusimicrobia bacterium RIFOXYB1_FULL_48_9]OGS10263.1 MAG: 3-dehydroquinate synthase [Elusimicrobia bacterium RIFOXYA1_FULL_47_7]OGS16617.1 MAG: 3-dehydroquinate synthase [Elusimicrobia bacterium RIFOXYA2_FULL_47_53]OGS25466.1 MAG: 3-dehydroquinate synthase [Elusimicrobia bacterium RIFOXYB12_FULL_50_12]OGS31595.1 MAG: 3-dehydroquinate synthase [Elusimicrobia bacterium RIFO
MNRIIVNLAERSYPIYVGARLENLGRELSRTGLTGRVFVVTNPKIKKLYYQRLLRGLKARGLEAVCAVIPDGEKYKTLKTVEKLYAMALKAGLDRKSVVVALGGGVVGDIAGFFAATYLRGLAFVQVPTTLLAMVDSSVGGKTGVDLKEGKNLVGAFYQPKLVWIDETVLGTLPPRHIRNGLSEVIKYGVIKDAGFFSYLEKSVERGLKAADYVKIISVSCRIKASVVKEDEYETRGKREILNFGHTFGHAVETLSGYSGYLHGEAVAIGMAVASDIAVKLKIISCPTAMRIKNLLKLAGLPLGLDRPRPFKQILEVMLRDKKTLGGKLRFVLPRGIGKAGVYSGIDPRVIKEVSEAL